MDARVNNVVLPVARKMMQADQAAKASAEGYLTATILHEICHGLGPVFARKDGKQVDINEAIGPAYAALEEAKADVAGMFSLQWLMAHGAVDKNRAEENYASYVAGLFRTLRFGAGEAHGRAEMMEFNYLVERKALAHGTAGYKIDYAAIPGVLADLAKELLEMEATGDRARTEAWFAKYGKMPSELKAALTVTSDIPVDIYPIFAFPDNLQ
jgi:hypothetical protein